MKSYRKVARRSRRLALAVRRLARNRPGTVIIVVLALLGMLALIGVFVLGLTGEANQGATYFANSQMAKKTSPTSDPNAFFDDALRQIILGPGVSEKQSALYGGTKSLLPTMFGRDTAPFNGAGINLIWNGATNTVAVDQNYNGLSTDAVDNQALLQLNLSPSAQGTSSVDLANFGGGVFPDPDTNYTYPDINSAFLSYDALVPNGTGNPVRVIVPSYHRPQILRAISPPNTWFPDPGPTFKTTWYTNPTTSKFCLHPHVEHRAIDSSGTLTAQQRFVSGLYPDGSGLGTPLYPFGIPGDKPDGTLTPPYAPPTAPTEGVWTVAAPPFNAATPGTIDYGVDVDNDGVNDAFYMDMGWPLLTTPDGTQQYVPLAAIKIIDLDSLLNLNVHGNRAQTAALPVASNFGGVGTMLSLSDQGLSGSEVNPIWALNARPLAGGPPGGPDFSGSVAALTSALQQYTLFFRTPPQSGALPTDDHQNNNFELGNMEWWNALDGRPQLSPGANPTVDPPTLSGSSFAGRWGENLTRLDPAVANMLGGAVLQAGPGVANDPFPLPGTSGADDNGNKNEGTGYPDAQGLVHTPFGHPLDFFGAGTFVTGTQGKFRQLIAEGSQQFPQYTQFLLHRGVTLPAPVQWTTFFANALTPLPAVADRLQIDEPSETFTEPARAALQPDDSIFGASEASIQMSKADFTALGNPARTASLMSYNFRDNDRAAQIRQRFTPVSWDPKSYGKEFLGLYTTGTDDARRLWEFTDLTLSTGIPVSQFPPNFPGASTALQPFRQDLFSLLQIVVPNPGVNTSTLPAAAFVNRPQRPMSINHLTEVVTLTDPATGNTYPNVRFRPLTPHPTGLPNTPIGTFPLVTQPEQVAGDLRRQEWLARYDRQRLARDIYVMLYTFGGGSDVLNYTTTNNTPRTATTGPLYSDDQLQEMAQFAVNWVDALDPDDHITIFEYDKNLFDGWNLDDNPYDASDPIPVADRGVVYGLERQQLAINEAMTVFAKQVTTSIIPILPRKHPDTQYNDKDFNWGFFFLELENVGPSPVSFQNQGWQIAVKESPGGVPSTLYGQETRMIVTAAQPSVPAGPNSRLTIGSVGGTDGATFTANLNQAATPPVPFPSWFVVNPNDSDTVNNPAPQYVKQFAIAPRAAYNPVTQVANPAALDLDMVTQPNNCLVMPAVPAVPPAALGTDGQIFPSTSTAPPATQFLQFINLAAVSNASSINLRIELRRRVDLSRTSPVNPDTAANTAQNLVQAIDNPWVVVDYIDVPVGLFNLKYDGAPADLAAQIQPQLKNLGAGNLPAFPLAPGAVSTERSQPLYHDPQLNPGAAPPHTRNGGASTRNTPTFQANSLGQDNDPVASGGTAIVPRTLWQPHFDRDFASIVELFNVPLYGPYGPNSNSAAAATTALSSTSPSTGLTHAMAARVNESGAAIAAETLVGADFAPADATGPFAHAVGFGTAGYRIQHPEGSASNQPNPATDLTENRWARVLNLVEVPTRAHNGLESQTLLQSPNVNAGSVGGPLGFFRTPGKININTLRYPELVAGLIDDGSVFSSNLPTGGLKFTAATAFPNLPGTFSVPYLLHDSVEGAARDWWLQFIAARDGIDPLPSASGGTGLPLPGMPRSVPAPLAGSPPAGTPPTGSHPFRGLSFTPYGSGIDGSLDANGYNGVLESTVLRTLPADGVSAPPSPDLRRRIFELGTNAEHTGVGATNLDYATKHRLLSKLVGNTTTRSNVFLIWIQIDYFQAKDVSPPNGVVRIGAKLGTNGVPGTSPAYRGFYVVDRSQALSLMKQQYLPVPDPTPPNAFVFSINQSFNYQSLVLYRQRIQ